MADRHTPSLALDPLAGSLAAMPSELAYTVNIELIDLLALLRAASNEAGDLDSGKSRDADGATCASSRAVSLIKMADDKVRKLLLSIEPYV